MPKFSVVISIAVLVASLVLLFSMLFTPQPIQIILQSGQEITTDTPEYFTLPEVLLLVTCSFLIGTAATYLFYNSERVKEAGRHEHPPKHDPESFRSIMPLLKDNEKSVIKALLESNGEMPQNKLASILGISKVKATRLLYRLEQKNLIIKQRHGITNMIRLQKKAD